MAVSAEHRSKFEAFHRLWWRLHISEKFSNGTEKTQTNKQTNKTYTHYVQPLQLFKVLISLVNNEL